MIITNEQRETLVSEIKTAINRNTRTNLLFSAELDNGRSDLFVMCRRDYEEQTAVKRFKRPFYIADKRGTFGFMRLRDDDGRILGYSDNTQHDDDTTDQNYKPSTDDVKKIKALIANGSPLYYYISEDLATLTGVILKEYTERAVYEYEQKRHRLFNLDKSTPYNSAVYIALYESYFTQYQSVYDLPTLTAGTDARKGYYGRLIDKAVKGEITINHIKRFPRGKGSRPKAWENPNDIISIGHAVGYNTFVQLNGQNTFASSENDIDDARREDLALFNHAVR